MNTKIDWLKVKEHIYNTIDITYLWQETIGIFTKKRNIKSPFRLDKNPGCSFFQDSKNQSIWYLYDFAYQIRYDIFMAISKKNNITYGKAILNIAIQYLDESTLKELGLKKNTTESYTNRINALYDNYMKDFKKSTNLIDKDEVKVVYDISYLDTTLSNNFLKKRISIYKGYYTPFILLTANTVSVRGSIKYTTTTDYPTFIWATQTEDGSLREHQIYRPYSDKKNKFRNLNSETFFSKGEAKQYKRSVIITKGFKDAYSLNKAGFSVLFKPGEGKSFDDDIFLDLKEKKYKNIFIFFDNDEPGKIASLNLKEKIEKQLKRLQINLNVHIMYVPESLNAKDYDDLVVNYSFKEAKLIMKKMIKNASE